MSPVPPSPFPPLTPPSFATFSVAWYFIRGRKDFKGPPVMANATAGSTGDEEKGAADDDDASSPRDKAS